MKEILWKIVCSLRAGPPVPSSSEPSPNGFVAAVLPQSVHANLCWQAAPFQSTCKYKIPLKFSTLVPSFSVLPASKGMQVKKEKIYSGRECWRGHQPSSGWTLWETWSHYRDRRLQNLRLGTASPWLRTELRISSFWIASLSSSCSPSHCKQTFYVHFFIQEW